MAEKYSQRKFVCYCSECGSYIKFTLDEVQYYGRGEYVSYRGVECPVCESPINVENNIQEIEED